MEDFCKKHGLPYKNTTKEHIGETAIIMFGRPPADAAAADDGEETESPEALETNDEI